jgi:phospholipid/cholesterol/gamma-HCH transport system substrate-binding protein
MTERVKAFWLGVFIIGAIILASLLILFLKPSVGDGQVTLRVRFSDIDKVSEGTRVTFAGKPVGVVKQIKEIANPRKAAADASGNLYIYELILKVDSSVKIYEYDEIVFATSGLLGEKSIAIIPKSPPPGAPPPHEVTGEILYARSTDKLQDTFSQITRVAITFENTLEEVNGFLATNREEFRIALHSLSGAAEQVHTFLARANEIDIAGRVSTVSDNLVAALSKAEVFFTNAEQERVLEKAGRTLDSLLQLTEQISYGEGTLTRLLNSDCFYIQLTTVLCQLQAILHDIKTYGILYQFDRRWQRTHQ